MAVKQFIYTANGWLTHLGPSIVINEKLEKREFIVKQVRRKDGRYLVSLYHFTAQNDVIENLNKCLPGMEVTVRFVVNSRIWYKNGVVQKKEGLPIVFQELKALDVFVMDEDKRVSSDKIWQVKHWDSVSEDEGIENEDDALTGERKRRFPDHKAYDAETFSAQVDYSEKDEGDELPF